MEIAAPARAMHLSLSERDHLFGPARHPAPQRVLRADHISPTKLRIVDRSSAPSQSP
ncbi:hypothetical protein [Paractinoplanes maris]|uniref:hypothetical protein n=1 Tax=Paractinoplanes maris TaxID=1734446 RepID=UPI0020209222|nr:hypothetical protein [Actinoplanes maris]